MKTNNYGTVHPVTYLHAPDEHNPQGHVNTGYVITATLKYLGDRRAYFMYYTKWDVSSCAVCSMVGWITFFQRCFQKFWPYFCKRIMTQASGIVNAVWRPFRMKVKVLWYVAQKIYSVSKGSWISDRSVLILQSSSLVSKLQGISRSFECNLLKGQEHSWGIRKLLSLDN
jgi:hypothetical protein